MTRWNDRPVTSKLPAGVTYRQLDYWTRRGYLRLGFPGTGHYREMPVGELAVAAWMGLLVRSGFRLEMAAEAGRLLAETGAWALQVSESVSVSVSVRTDGSTPPYAPDPDWL